AYILGLQNRMPVGFVLCRFCVVAGLWLVTDGCRLPAVKPFMTYNFFLYATHFGLVRFINKAFARKFAGIPMVPVILFFLMPLMILSVNGIAAQIMRRRMPRTWELLNGGR
ncbi:MAG: acyltransferase, partial [Brotaphodocola sp.]